MKNIRMRTFACSLLAAIGVAILQSPVQAQGPSGITYKQFDHPNAVTSTSVNGINDFGDFVGVYDDAQGKYHGFLGHKGSTQITPIDYPGADQTYIFRINNSNKIVGTYFDKNGYQHGFLRAPGYPPVYISFDMPGAGQSKYAPFELGTGLGTSGYGLNNLGDIVGQFADANSIGHGFIRSHDAYVAYSHPGAGPFPGYYGGSGFAGINDSGDLAGGYATSNPYDPIFTHGFMLTSGGLTAIDPPGSIFTQVFGINNRQEVSGFYYDVYEIGHGYIYKNGVYQIIDVPGAVYVSTVGTVNMNKDFVGEFVDGFGITHGYIATKK